MTKKEMIEAILDKSGISEKSYSKCLSRMSSICKEDIERFFNYVKNGDLSASYIVHVVTGIVKI